jgi:hypothetical protein
MEISLLTCLLYQDSQYPKDKCSTGAIPTKSKILISDVVLDPPEAYQIG